MISSSKTRQPVDEPKRNETPQSAPAPQPSSAPPQPKQSETPSVSAPPKQSVETSRLPPPPPPDLPRPPERKKASKAAAVEQPPAAPPSKWRDLPQDPIERARCRASVSGEAQGLLAIINGLMQKAPPHLPMQDWERETLTVPLEEVVYKYGANIDPLVSLAIAAGSIALVRWQMHLQAKKAEEAKKERKVPEDKDEPPKIAAA